MTEESQAPEGADERKAAEQNYANTAFNYPEAPIGSRDWCLYWDGWQARAALATQPQAAPAGLSEAHRQELIMLRSRVRTQRDELAKLKKGSPAPAERGVYGWAYMVNGAHQGFLRGSEPPPDDAYDAGTLVALHAGKPQPKGMPVGWRPEVVAFADAMERKLRANEWKGTWKHDAPGALMDRVHEELTEFRDELFTRGPRDTDEHKAALLNEAADVANMLMMVVDTSGALPTQAPAVAHGWQPIEQAPKVGPLLLLFPPIGGWVAGAWRGGWSYVEECWVIHTPMQDATGRNVCLTLPEQPIAFMPLPDPPNEPRCPDCRYQRGHAIGCDRNPVDLALRAMPKPPVQGSQP